PQAVPALPRHARRGNQPGSGEGGDEVARPRDRRVAAADVPARRGRRGEGPQDARGVRAAVTGLSGIGSDTLHPFQPTRRDGWAFGFPIRIIVLVWLPLPHKPETR